VNHQRTAAKSVLR